MTNPAATSLRGWLLLLLVICGLRPAESFSQDAPTYHTAQVDSALAAMRADRARDDRATVRTTQRILAALGPQGDPCRRSEAFSFRSASLTKLGELDSALMCAQRALGSYEPGCDSTLLMRAYLAYAVLWISTGDMPLVDSVCSLALSHWNVDWYAPGIRSSLVTNKAIARVMQGDVDAAFAGFRTALDMGRAINDPLDIGDALSNLGKMKHMTGDLDSAIWYLTEALNGDREAGLTKRIARRYSGLAGLYLDKKEYDKVTALFDSASVFARRSGDIELLSTIEQGLYNHYSSIGRYEEAFDHAVLHAQYKDSLLNIEKVRSLADMQEKYESEKKAREITGLRASNLEVELDRSRVKRTRNLYLFIGLGVLGAAVGLWSRLRIVHRSRAAIRKEKEISEGLLHNILPEEVAAELKVKGYADVREFPQATILFTDFKGFTQLTEKLSAAQLVAEIDHCFKAFDGVMEKYSIEKIKTIGDAYMAAGGLPDPAHGLPADVVRAALEMQDFMAAYKAERTAQGRLFFEMRVGIHTGPVIAGIVGVKKFAYDIWGDTVNTASRMESSGEVGQVNISEATYELVKNETGLSFTPRGKVQAKGKGEMEMYFVQRA